jgi:sialidase-1
MSYFNRASRRTTGRGSDLQVASGWKTAAWAAIVGRNHPEDVMQRAIWIAAIVFALGGSTASSQEPVPLTPELRDRCLDVLRRALGGMADKPENFWPAMHAAEALTLAGHGGEVVVLLRDRLPKEQDHQRRCGLAREIVRAGRKEPLAVLFEILADDSSSGRVHAAESLYKVNEIGDGVQLEAAFAQTEDKRLQLMAAAALARAGRTESLKAHRAALNSEDRELRKIGVWVLALLGGATDAPAIQNVLAAENDELARAYCINALACLGNADARILLGKNLSSRDPAVRTYSAEFAGHSRSVEHRPQLIRLLADENVDVRVRAAQSLIAFSR